MRRLTAAEREVLRAVVLAGAPKDDGAQAALLAQVDAAQVTGPSCTCGCASIGLSVDRAAALPADLSEFGADAVEDDYAAGFRIALVDGYLDDVEFYGYGDSDNSVWPPAELIR